MATSDLAEERWQRILTLEAENRSLRTEAQDASMLAGIYERERDEARSLNSKLQAELIEASTLMREMARIRRLRTSTKLKSIHENLRDVETHVRSLIELTKHAQ